MDAKNTKRSLLKNPKLYGFIFIGIVALAATSFLANSNFNLGVARATTSTFVASTTATMHTSASEGFLAITGFTGYTLTDGGGGDVTITRSGANVNGNLTYQEDLDGNGTYGDAISQIDDAVSVIGVADTAAVQSVTQITLDSAFADTETLVISNCTITFVAAGTEDLNCAGDNAATINITDNATATAQANRLKSLTGLTSYTAGDDTGGSNAIFKITHTGTATNGNPSEGSGITDAASNVTVVGNGSGESVVGVAFVAGTASVDTISITGDIPSGAKIRINSAIVITFGATSSDTDVSNNTAALSRFQEQQNQTTTFTPSSVTSGETFIVTIEGTNYYYSASSGATAAIVVTALSPLVDADSAVSCTEDNTAITCTTATGPAAFAYDAVVDTTPAISSVTPSVSSPSNANSITYTVVFNESVSGVGTGDFTLTTTGSVSATIASVSGSGTTHTVTVNSITGDGTLRLNVVDDDTIISALTTPLGGTSNNGTYNTTAITIDNTAPADPTSSLSAGSYTGTKTATLTFYGSGIGYTIDGSTPTCTMDYASTVDLTITATQTVKLIDCDTAGNDSSITTYTYTINAAGAVAVVWGGGGGGGGGGYGGYVAPTQTSTTTSQVTTPTTPPTPPQTNTKDCTPTAVGLMTGEGTYTRDLKFGDKGKDVYELQTFLEETGLLVVPEGNIKGLFGLLTGEALKKYQTAACITEDGFGTITRSHFGHTTVASTSTSTATATPTTTPSKTGRLTTPLYLGVTNVEDVKVLQGFLAKQGKDIYPDPVSTGEFDETVELAVKAFQLKQEITTEDNIAYGYVGPATRAKINSMLTTTE